MRVNATPNWYKELSLLQSQMKALREDIPLYLREKKGDDIKDLEAFDIKLNSMINRLDRAFRELTTPPDGV